jgi:hypothetical protein
MMVKAAAKETAVFEREGFEGSPDLKHGLMSCFKGEWPTCSEAEGAKSPLRWFYK